MGETVGNGRDMALSEGGQLIATYERYVAWVDHPDYRLRFAVVDENGELVIPIITGANNVDGVRVVYADGT